MRVFACFTSFFFFLPTPLSSFLYYFFRFDCVKFEDLLVTFFVKFNVCKMAGIDAANF